VPDHWAVFRPAPKPTQALPLGARSVGRFGFARAQVVDDLPARGFVQLYWCESGRVRFAVDGGTVLAGPGGVFLFRPHDPHQVATVEDGTVYSWFTCDGPLAQAVAEAFGLVAPWPRPAGPPPEPLLRRLAAVIADPMPAAERTASALAWELLSAAASGGQSGAVADDVVERLRRELVDRAADPALSVARLAGSLGVERSVLTRRFTRALGVAPKPYLQSLRLGRAMALLHGTAEPVAAVALACGFADPAYFARAFRAHTGLSPEGFRGRRG
jgi:AraC-like DNA-binding protein